MISVVIPLYNEEETIPLLFARLKASSITWGDCEIIFIDDGSTDSTLAQVKGLIRQSDSLPIRVLSFSRNFGHQIAISAGLNYARGRAVVIIDGDLQDPPELVGKLINKWQQGFEIIYAIRQKRKENVFKRSAYYLFYRLLQRLAKIEIPLDAGDFCLLDRKVVDIINQMPEQNRFIRGLRAWVGFKTVGIEYERDKRAKGLPKYTLSKLSRLALDGLISFSLVPLKLSIYTGFLVTILSFFVGIMLLILKLVIGIKVAGWTSLVLIIFFLSGVQLFIMGVLGEYIGRIYIEVQKRPLYIIKEKCGFDG